METAARLVENDPKLMDEMHDSVVSDCEEWHKRKSQKTSATTNNGTDNSSAQNIGRQGLILFKTYTSTGTDLLNIQS